MKIKVIDGKLSVPDDVEIPYIEGDGIGEDIFKASIPVWNEAVRKAYNGRRKVNWIEVYAGEKSYKKHGEYLPKETLDTLKEYIVSIKGPLTTPVGGGYRSINVAIRQELDLFAVVRPVKYFKGIETPVKHPERVDIVIFREATEDLYAGIEWQKGSKEASMIKEFLKNNFGINIREDTGIGIKVMSEFGTKRLMRVALDYTIKTNMNTITIMHKGNIMKYTEGAFREWCYELALGEYRDYVVTEEELKNGASRDGKILINDVIADNMFQQVLTKPENFKIIVAPNLNGDYISDALAAQVGGLGMAPGGNIGNPYAVFEPTHGSAPKYAGLDKVNPSSLILSGCLMFEYIGWKEVSDMIINAIQKVIQNKTVTYDLAREMEGAKEVKCSEFAELVIKNL
ncbi:MAG: isocitrate dehydrogenase (NADP(+)) [Spirochaetia bacterium]|nr:isocitrate dehydrogenase (NADP(+)) [Spirochaetota bacterium]MCX8097063.1 isocitrate dehydrogenase (NADP(+)) [Spirochaetota bacterium]MDW8111742.1 isocitrate dehydrogenase (NADP(+)) [Spirochaetia bacterium]